MEMKKLETLCKLIKIYENWKKKKKMKKKVTLCVSGLDKIRCIC